MVDEESHGVPKQFNATQDNKMKALHPTQAKRTWFGKYKDKILFSPDFDKTGQEITDLFEVSAKEDA